MNFKKVNVAAGWFVGLIASLVYILTSEKSGSLWDCGEFVSACFKVGLPHPPGAPLFVLLGRFFIVLFGDNPATAAKAVNIMNALASGMTIVFLFWTITHYARKLVMGNLEEPDRNQTISIIAAGVVGGLAYTFTDSFWYSAVEGEVYALSSLFTALAFWAIVKWERAYDEAGDSRSARNRADRWIVFLFFSLGLSIGIHLLGLLVIPAAVMTYYFKRYKYSRWGAIWAFLLGCLITGIVQVVVIKWTVLIAGYFDRVFVNSFHLGFFSGFAFFFILLGVLVWLGLRYAARKQYAFLRLGLWSFIFMLLGYSVYLTTMERSNANPALDMNDVDNPMSLVYYLGRDQYGSQPILWGTHFLAQPVDLVEKGSKYVKGDESYVELPPDKEYKYNSSDYQFFPRVWDPSEDQRHATFYIQWLNLPTVRARQTSIVTGVSDGYIQVQDQTGKEDNYPFDYGYAPKVQRGQMVEQGGILAVKIPNYGTNMEWFFTYQLGFMYMRYFMWNFSGRQNDLQGGGNVRDGNWTTGIGFYDSFRLGNQSAMPASIKDNKANNSLFMLPFILGMLGMVFHFLKDRKDFIVTFLFFFFTGVAIVVYLNQAGNQPRERDYAFAGSFYVFSIWIGLAVIAIIRLAREVQDKLSYSNTLSYGAVATAVVVFFSATWNSVGAALISGILAGAFFLLVSLALIHAVRAIGKGNLRMAGLTAGALTLIVPVLMASQEWNDHDRSKKTLAPDVARDYLSGCPKDAILFTFGDNDTYPLWYLQEVEGFRKDVRIVNTSLLGIDWYVNQLRYKVNESAPVPMVWNKDQIRALSYVTFDPNAANAPVMNISDALQKMAQQNPISSFPTRKLNIPVNPAAAANFSADSTTGPVLSSIDLDLGTDKNYLSLDQLTMLNILATTGFSRPICFTSPYGEIGFGPYLKQVGMIYQLVPQKSMNPQGSMDLAKTYNLLMNEFRGGNANVNGVYFDEENRRHLSFIRNTYAVAAINLADQGKKQDAVNLLERSESLIKPEQLPYAMVSRGNNHNQFGRIYLEAAYKAGHMKLAEKISSALEKDLKDQLAYYQYLKGNKEDAYGSFMDEDQLCTRLLEYLKQMKAQYTPGGMKPPTPELPDSSKPMP